ncbi:hypothetical protein, partial [Amycolatopsis kentuckyensis]|uniref:hypothetical protein n=1 Tax=Amycolatopsis kentuckyensis TaxID=218823 RepID=UPI001ABEFDD6
SAGSPASPTSRVPTPMRQPKVAPPRQPDPFALSREQRRRGARVVASAADDAGDCATLLAILGLDPADGLTAPDVEPPSRPDRAARTARTGTPPAASTT